MFLGGEEFVAGQPLRIVFGVLDANGLSIENGDLLARFIVEEGSTREVDLTWFGFDFDETPIEPGAPGGYYRVATGPLDVGIASIEVSLRTDQSVKGTAAFEVRPVPRAPTQGGEVPVVVTPVAGDPDALVCTREPVCPLHEISLDAALAGDQPLLVVVGSPKLCTSRTCGPVLEEVLALRARHPERRFLHVEPYASLSTADLAPIMTTWRLPSEPWVFLLDASGRVEARFEGPVSRDEISAALG